MCVFFLKIEYRYCTKMYMKIIFSLSQTSGQWEPTGRKSPDTRWDRNGTHKETLQT